MDMVPFPYPLAHRSASAARSHVAERQEKARKHGAFSPKTYVADETAVYRMPDGRMRTAYDPYAPCAPCGAEPGLGSVKYVVEHHPNETHSYRPEILSFRSAFEIEAAGEPMDWTASALLVSNGKTALLICANEEDMAERLSGRSDQTRVVRAPITVGNAEAGGTLQYFCATSAIGGTEIHASTSEDGLLASIRKRFSFIPSGNSFDEFRSSLEAHADRCGWSVCLGNADELSAGLEAFPDGFIRDHSREAEPSL